MFTGLVQDVGTLLTVQPGATTDLWIRTALGASTFERGESIAVEGACLTVVETKDDQFKVQAAPETLRVTTLGDLKPGAKVNLERALRLSDRLGGHLVLGHVDAVGEILAKRKDGGSLVVEVSLPETLAPYLIMKGSITIDGVSLTVNTLEKDRFSVQLIPETQERTTLPQKAVGQRVNLEGDVIGKYVARLYSLGPREGGQALSEAQLRNAGSWGQTR